MTRPLLGAALLTLWAALPAPAAATPAAAEAAPLLTLDRLFANPPLAGTTPRALSVAPDGRHIAWLEPRADDQLRFDLWVRPTAGGEARMAVDSLALSPTPAALGEAELMRRERARLASVRGLTEYQWAPDGQAILVPLDGDLWLAPLDGPPRRLTATPATEIDAKVSPRGTHVSFVADQNLFVLPLATGRARAITVDGGGPLSHGVAEFVAQEEMGRMTGHWWSPDDRRLAYATVDESAVAIATRAAIGSDGTRMVQQRYPFAGTANARVALSIAPVGGGRPVRVDLGADPEIYLARVQWAGPDRLLVQRQSRDQTRLDILDIDAASGRGRILLTERWPTWINLHDSLVPLADGSLLWLSERSGHRHLWRIAADGRATPVTSGPWDVDELKAVDEAGGTILFTGFADTPLEKALYRAPLDGSRPPERLSPAGGWAEAVADRLGRAALITRSTPAQPPLVELWRAEDARRTPVGGLPVEQTPYAPFLAAHVAPRFGTLKAADGTTDLHYSLLLPPGLKPGARAPVIFEVYGGPGVTRVQRAWARTTPIHQWLAQQGHVVFMVDNRGTPHRGRAFADPLHRRVGITEVEDQMAALAWLKAQPFVDPDRVAAWGWSYGGYMVLRLLTEHPGAFAAGVSGAPVTDWTLYDTHYTERYLGNPAIDRAPYDAADVNRRADRLADPLLLIHGLADDNVVFDHSARMMAALQAAGRPFETMVYPGQSHAIRDPAMQRHLWQTIRAFLDRSLSKGGGSPDRSPAPR